MALVMKCVKWVGYVDKPDADTHVKQGDFIIESSSAGVTVIHGSLSHVLQSAIMLLP